MELALVLRWIGWRGALALVLLASLAGQSWRLDVAQKALAIAATKQVTAERDAEHAARTEEQNPRPLRRWRGDRLRERGRLMHKLPVSVWLLTCALGISSCASVGRAAKPVCPVLPPAPASLMQKPTTEQRVRAELFAPPPSATPRSKGSKP
jgi:hypothetical protein